MESNLRLKIFMYLLLNHLLTISDLEWLMEEARNSNETVFTNGNLHQYTNDLVERLLDD